MDVPLLEGHVLTRNETQEMLVVTQWDSPGSVRIPVVAPAFPRTLRLPNGNAQSVVNPVYLQRTQQIITFVRSTAKPTSGAFQQWWSLDFTENATDESEAGIDITVASDRVGGATLTEAFGAGSIIAVYTILFLGAFVSLLLIMHAPRAHTLCCSCRCAHALLKSSCLTMPPSSCAH